jgi:hypothetical protein
MRAAGLAHSSVAAETLAPDIALDEFFPRKIHGGVFAIPDSMRVSNGLCPFVHTVSISTPYRAFTCLRFSLNVSVSIPFVST